MVRYGGWVGRRRGAGEGAGVGGGCWWESGSGLNPSLGPFVLAMGPKSASHRPKHA